MRLALISCLLLTLCAPAQERRRAQLQRPAAAGGDFVTDSFTDANSTALGSHTGELGATWTFHEDYSPGGGLEIQSNRLQPKATFAIDQVWWASGVPPSANYYVQSTIHTFTYFIQSYEGVVGRLDTTAVTFYLAQYDPDENGNDGAWTLYKAVAGAYTKLGTYNQHLADNTDYVVRLTMTGTTIDLSVDGVSRISVTDSAISAAGKCGVRMFSNFSTIVAALDTFSAR